MESLGEKTEKMINTEQRLKMPLQGMAEGGLTDEREKQKGQKVKKEMERQRPVEESGEEHKR